MNTKIELGARTKFDIDEILYFQADINYTIIHYANGRKQIISYTLKKIEKHLLQHTNFIRISRRYLINETQSKILKHGKFETKDGLILEASRRKKLLLLPGI